MRSINPFCRPVVCASEKNGSSGRILTICLIVLEAVATAISSEGAVQHTAEELIEKIVESEHKIRDVQAEYLFCEPDTNIPLLYAHWAYQSDKELIAGMGFRPAGSDLEYLISIKSIFSLDEKQRFYSYRAEVQKGFKQLLINTPTLFDLDMFRSWMTPNSLLGFDISCGSRRSFGESLDLAMEITLRERTERIEDHNCYCLEAVGIKNPEFIYDVRAWIDIDRDFRPLRVESFYNSIGGIQYRPFERLHRKIYDIKLRKVNGIWFPIEGKRDTFTYKRVLPSELEGLTEEQARQKFSERDFEKLVQKAKDIPVLSVPTRKILVDINSIRLNQGIEAKKFVVEPPPGCDVWDEIEDKRYTVENGEGTHLEFEVSFLKLKRFAPPEFMKVIYPDTLVGCRLQDLSQFRIGLNSDQFEGKPLLLCIWDMQQRPSRAFIKELAGRSKRLEQQGLVLIGIQASNVNENELKGWTTTNGISFPVILSEANEQHTQLSLAAKSLPWLILTDNRHIVTAEGFGLDELDEKMKR